MPRVGEKIERCCENFMICGTEYVPDVPEPLHIRLFPFPFGFILVAFD